MTIRMQRLIALASIKASLEAAIANVELLAAMEDADDGPDAADGPTAASPGTSDAPPQGEWVDVFGGERVWVPET